MKKTDQIIKRVFDLFLSIFLLVISFPVIFIAWLIASIDSGMNGLYVQDRVGKNGIRFKVYKIRTMKLNKFIDTSVTTVNDIRITYTGKYLRLFKIDELPQLFNIIRGDMSFVGPRPDVEGFADKLIGNDRIILTVRPGITGPATLKYRNEEKILALQSDPESYNQKVIWPDKVKINRNYIETYSLIKDLKYIFITVFGSRFFNES